MEIVEVRCKNCGKRIYVLGDYLREKMFCTLGCMDSYIAFSPSGRTPG